MSETMMLTKSIVIILVDFIGVPFIKGEEQKRFQFLSSN